jgi:hypothetical protein
MSLQQLRNVTFGKSKANATGTLGVGYTMLDYTGNIITSRTTSGVYQLTSGSGLYAAYVTFPDNFHGQLLWDTGTAFAETYYATEQYNVEENNPLIDTIHSNIEIVTGTLNVLASDVEFIKHIEGGRWRIVSDQMIFYKSDNITEVARFDLYDQFGSPSSETVFERRRT